MSGSLETSDLSVEDFTAHSHASFFKYPSDSDAGTGLILVRTLPEKQN